MGDNANEQDPEQDDHSQAAVTRRSFVVGVAAAGAAVTAANTLPSRRTVSSYLARNSFITASSDRTFGGTATVGSGVSHG